MIKFLAKLFKTPKNNSKIQVSYIGVGRGGQPLIYKV
jgi:hypothetical protein